MDSHGTVAEDLRVYRLELGISLAYQTVEPHKTGRHFPASKKSAEGSACAMAINAFAKYVLVARPETVG
jgi:hypothetical protein